MFLMIHAVLDWSRESAAIIMQDPVRYGKSLKKLIVQWLNNPQFNNQGLYENRVLNHCLHDTITMVMVKHVTNDTHVHPPWSIQQKWSWANHVVQAIDEASWNCTNICQIIEEEWGKMMNKVSSFELSFGKLLTYLQAQNNENCHFLSLITKSFFKILNFSVYEFSKFLCVHIHHNNQKKCYKN